MPAESPIDLETTDEEIERFFSHLRSSGAERFETVEQLTGGSMGLVEVVLDRALQRRLARKVAQHESALKLFARETAITARLDHPNIIPVHEVGLDEQDRLYFTMKLIEGETLSQRIARLHEGGLKHSDLMDLLEPVLRVCDALAFAHDKGIAHCDLKPDNIMHCSQPRSR